MTVEYRFTEEEEKFRAEVREFFAQELPPGHWRMQNDRDEIGPEEQAFNQQFVKKLAERGWLTLHWPEEYGGLAASPMQQLIFNEESGYSRAPGGGMGVQMAGPSIMHHGTAAQKSRHLAAIAAGDEVWCQGFSEPGSGSDLASLQTRAVLDGDDYVLNGQKIWNSGGHLADWCMMLVRTDPAAPKHRGISFLLMDMKSAGVTVRPLVNMLGTHAFNEIFLEDVRVPRSNLVGEENRGWYVATTTLDYERSGIARIAWGQRVLEEMVAHVRAHPELRTPSRRARLADLWIASETSRLLAYRVTWLQSQEQVPNYEASMSKLFSSEVQTAITQEGVNLLGPAGALRRGSAGDPPLWGAMPEAYLGVTTFTIAAGTSEIQRNIIAQRGLGLPRN